MLSLNAVVKWSGYSLWAKSVSHQGKELFGSSDREAVLGVNMANEDSLAINLGSLLTEKKLTREDWVPQLSGLVSGFKVCPPQAIPSWWTFTSSCR